MDLKNIKIMLIGQTEAGKTTLIENLMNDRPGGLKTQAIEFHKNFIDTPGEFLENSGYFKALIITSYDADLILFLEDATAETCFFPPNFASTFNRTVAGVVTKMDKGGDVERARENLVAAGADPVFTISNYDPDSLTELRAYLEEFVREHEV